MNAELFSNSESKYSPQYPIFMGAEERIWTLEGGRGGRLEKTA
jgi:hypothetical protein